MASTARVAFVVLVMLVALGAITGCTHPMPLTGEITHPVTADGWPLTLEHFRPAPASRAPRRVEPVILCHGFMANRTYFKMTGERSLAAMLRADGYDVWLVDLRGRDDAGAPGFFLGERTYSYSTDDYILRDADTAISHVLAATRARQVTWIGHSMGGILAYARLGSFGEQRIARLVAIGSPGALPLLGRTLLDWYELQGGLAALAVLPTAPFARFQAATGLPVAPRSLLDMLWYEPNLDPEIRDQLLRHTATNVSKPEARQFLRAFHDGEFVSADGAIPYSRNLVNVRVPTLFIAGRRDNLGEPATLRLAYDRVSSADKTLIIAERSRGFHEDYGHTDLLVGKSAHLDIHPRILAWLGARDGR